MGNQAFSFPVTTRAVAERALAGLGASADALNDMLLDIQPTATPVEFDAVRRVVGQVLGTQFQMVVPLLEQHPDLDKHGLLGGSVT